MSTKGKDQVVYASSIPSAEAFGTPTVWQSYSFAPEWFKDALHEAISGTDHNSRRREILFSVCTIESYLFEWVRDDVLQRDFKKLGTYFPSAIGKKDARPLLYKLKDVPKDLHNHGLIPKVPNYTKADFKDFYTLIAYRNGLVHALASRPDTASIKTSEKPRPSKTELDQLASGWATNIVVVLIKYLHSATGTLTPHWLVKP